MPKNFQTKLSFSQTKRQRLATQISARFVWTSANRHSRWAVFLIWEPTIDITDKHTQNSAIWQPVNFRWKDKAYNIISIINRNPEEKEILPESTTKRGSNCRHSHSKPCSSAMKVWAQVTVCACTSLEHVTGFTEVKFSVKIAWHCCDLIIQSGHWKWYEWVKLNENYHYAKLDLHCIYSVRENHNVKVFATHRQSASRPDTDRYMDTFFMWVKNGPSDGLNSDGCPLSCHKLY